ncbi:MAG: aldose epimerase family protein [Rhizobiaceae bacterium]
MDIFGQTPDGETVQIVEISGGGLTAKVMSWGAGIQDLRLKGHAAPLVLGFSDFDNYLHHSPYFAVNVGRAVNRIRGGLLTIDGVTYQLEKNFRERHCIHGGSNGIGTRNWTFVAVSKDEAVLEIRCPDGNMGFPGNLDIRCTYRVSGKGVFSVVFEAVTDRPTICNLAHHSYFNLQDGGASDILDHRVSIFADAYLPGDEDLIPDGRVLPVAGSEHDFRELRAVRRLKDGAQVIYDNTWCVASSRGPLRHVMHVEAPTSGVVMDTFTTEAGAHLYAGNTIPSGPAGLSGKSYFPYAGFCMETQGWPNSSQHPYFPQDMLRPGETLRQETEYQFSKIK